MKNKILLLSSALALIILSSCSITTILIDYNKFYKVSKKTTQTEFLKEHEDNVENTFELTVNNEKYTVCLVEIVTLIESYTTSRTENTATGTTRIRDTQNKKDNNPYCFVFKNNHFFFSGFIFEFRRNTDSGIQVLGNEISDYLYSEKGTN